MGSRGGGGSNGGGSQGIPAASRKMVQSLKEIVNGVPEAEIYSTLKDCNMDPNEAVNRLLSQDTFHEVKSKREKKKEFKDSTDFRPRGGGGSTSNRGGRSGADRYTGRSGSTQFSSYEHGKYTNKRENVTSSFTSSSTPAPKVAPSYTNWNPPTSSDSRGHENEASTYNASDSASVSQPSSGYQSAWAGAPGQKSMADIVKMGRPQNKSYNYSNPPPPQTTTHNHAPPPPPTVSHHDDIASSPDNDWPSIEKPQPVNLHTITDTQTESVISSGQSNLQFESNNQNLGYETNEVELQDESSSEDQEEDYENDSQEGNLDNFVEEDDAPISSLNANIHEENHVDPPQEDDAPSVVIPDHLQVHTADCSHLSFGSFGANINQGYSGHFTSTADAEPEPEPVTSSVEHSETTNLEYYEDGPTRTLDRTGATAENYDLPSASQAALKQEEHEVTRGNQYGFPPATHAQSHTFDTSQLLNPNFPQSQTPSQTQISTPFLNVMSANGHPVRESDLSSYSQFSVSQSMPTRYANSASPINDPTISMAEALKNVGLNSSQPAQHTLPTGPAVPSHLMHPYSQPTLPLGPFANMISYPFLPQSYTYMPSGFQPNSYQQLAAMLPQYKNSLSSSLPQSANVPSGYGSFGNSTAVPGNYEEAHYKDTNNQLLSLQQNEWVHGGGSRTMAGVPPSAYYSLQSQNHHHHQQQQQQQQQLQQQQQQLHQQQQQLQQQQQQPQPPSGFRQGQQPALGYGGAGLNYPDFFHSQAGVPQEHQLQQNPRDGGSQGQGQQKLQSQQLWQNGY